MYKSRADLLRRQAVEPVDDGVDEVIRGREAGLERGEHGDALRELALELLGELAGGGIDCVRCRSERRV